MNYLRNQFLVPFYSFEWETFFFLIMGVFWWVSQHSPGPSSRYEGKSEAQMVRVEALTCTNDAQTIPFEFHVKYSNGRGHHPSPFTFWRKEKSRNNKTWSTNTHKRCTNDSDCISFEIVMWGAGGTTQAPLCSISREEWSTNNESGSTNMHKRFSSNFMSNTQMGVGAGVTLAPHRVLRKGEKHKR